MSQMLQDDLSTVDVQAYYVRQRNVLLVRGKFGPLYMDYYLHLMQHGIKHEREYDERLKTALSALALYLCSRPQDETTAWTIHIHRPALNGVVFDDLVSPLAELHCPFVFDLETDSDDGL